MVGNTKSRTKSILVTTCAFSQRNLYPLWSRKMNFTIAKIVKCEHNTYQGTLISSP